MDNRRLYATPPYKQKYDAPAISMYLMSNSSPVMEKISCMNCKRTIYDLKGTVDKVINTPMPVVDFDMAINIMCKLCKQKYRLLINVS
jgi:hypothetical protein